MKNKFLFVAASLLFSAVSAVSFAEENQQMSGEKIAAHKQQMITNLNAQKATIDQTISCVNAAQDGQAIKKCHEIREAAARKMQEDNIANRKAELQNQMNKLNEKEQNLKNKPINGDRK